MAETIETLMATRHNLLADMTVLSEKLEANRDAIDKLHAAKSSNDWGAVSGTAEVVAIETTSTKITIDKPILAAKVAALKATK